MSVLSTDSLDVNGDMDWEFHEKLTIMSGTVNRLWHNGVTRYVGMEGIICGEAYRLRFVITRITYAFASGSTSCTPDSTLPVPHPTRAGGIA